MYKKQLTLLPMLIVFILFLSGTANAMDGMKTIQAYEEPYFINYNGEESLANGKLISYKQSSYIPLTDAAELLGLALESSTGDIYLSGNPTITLSKSVNSLPKETVNAVDLLRINPKIGTHAGIVIEDGKLSTPIFSKNSSQRLYPASTTKIMTILLALTYGDLNETVTIGKSAINIPYDSSKAGIKPGDQMSLEQLLYAMMLPSGNDAAMAVAEHIGGSVPQFVQMMNEQAKKLGAKNTSFTNPHGYHHPNLYTTAADLALIVNEAAKNEAFLRITHTPIYTAHYRNMYGQAITKTWKNTNALVQTSSPYYLPSVLAGKTGYTGEAKHNLVSIVTRGNHDYIIVLLRGENKQRYIDTKNLVNATSKKRSQIKDERRKITILPFENKLFINNEEYPTGEDVFVKDGEIFISTDMIIKLSPDLRNAKVSDTQILKGSFNNEILPFGQDQPAIQNGRMLVPIKAFFEKAGLTLNWNQKTKTVEAYSSDTVIQMKINSKNATINSQKVTLDVPATILNGRTLVPLRFISEATDSTIDWGRGRTLFLY